MFIIRSTKYKFVISFLVLLNFNHFSLAENKNITMTNSSLTISKQAKIKPDTFILKVPTLSQIYPDFIPNGCECVAENMALKFKGITKFSNKELISQMNNADDPRLGFMGDMYSFKYYKGTIPTVWPERIVEQVKQFLPNSYYSNSLTLEQLENEVINGNPVLVWYSWEKVDKIILSYDPLNPIKTSSGLHCTLLVGYDKDNWYFNDPAYGKVRKLDKKNFLQ